MPSPGQSPNRQTWPGATGAAGKAYGAEKELLGCNPPPPPQSCAQKSRKFGRELSIVPVIVPDGVPGEKLSIPLENGPPIVAAPLPPTNCPLMVDILNELSVCCWK